MREDLICLIAFILGWLISKMMGDGFSIGGGEVCRPARDRSFSVKNAFNDKYGQELMNELHKLSYEDERIYCQNKKDKKDCDHFGAAKCEMQKENCVPKNMPEKKQHYPTYKEICDNWVKTGNGCGGLSDTCKSTYSLADDNIDCYKGDISSCQRCCYDDPDNTDCCDKVKKNCIDNIKKNDKDFIKNHNIDVNTNTLYSIFGKCEYCKKYNELAGTPDKDKKTKICMNEHVNTCKSGDYTHQSKCPFHSEGANCRHNPCGGAIFCPDYLTMIKTKPDVYNGCPGSYKRPERKSPPPPPAKHVMTQAEIIAHNNKVRAGKKKVDCKHIGEKIASFMFDSVHGQDGGCKKGTGILGHWG